MLLGEHRQAINGMGQIALPQQVRSELKGALIVTRGFEGNLVLYPNQQWRELAEKLLARPVSNHDIRALRRRFFSGAVELWADQDGRINLPPSLREFAGINGEVILAGMYDHLELWSVEQWSRIVESSIGEEFSDEQWDGIGI